MVIRKTKGKVARFSKQASSRPPRIANAPTLKQSRLSRSIQICLWVAHLSIRVTQITTADSLRTQAKMLTATSAAATAALRTRGRKP